MTSHLPNAPHGWLVAPLGEIVEILDSRRVPVNGKERATREGDVPYYGATGQVGWIDDYLFDEELVLLGEDAAPFLDRSKPVAYTIHGKSWVNNHAHVLKALGGMPNEFLKHQLNQIEYRPFVSGTTRLKLSQAPMRRIPLVIPPRQEQERIADALDSYFSRLDDVVATLERVQRNLKRYRASVLKAAVEGRLVSTEAELARKEGRDYEPADVLLTRILEERKARWIDQQAEKGRARAEAKATKAGKPWTKADDQAALAKARTAATKKYKEPAPPDTSELPELPEGWCWVTIEELCDVGTGATPKRDQGSFWNAGTIPWVTSAAVNSGRVTACQEHVTEKALATTNLTLYPPGTILVAMYGEGKTRGKAALLEIESTTNQALAALALYGMAAHVRQWLLLFLAHNYAETRRMSAGGVQPNLNLSLVRSIVVPLPPVSEQIRITRLAETQLSYADKVGVVCDESARRSKRLRQSILKWAFEGKLADQDPNHEPASVLLDRIKAERETAQAAAKAKKKPARKPRKKKSA